MFAARLARRRKRLYSSSEHTLFILALFTALRAYSFCAVASNLLRIRRFVIVRDFFLRVRGRLLCMFFCGQPSARRRAMLYIKVKSELSAGTPRRKCIVLVGSPRRGDGLSLMIN